MSALLEVAGVSKSFGPVKAVDNIDLTIGANEFFALLGPSGCGKTTLLRMIAGFEMPDQGRIILAGQDITGVKANKRPINLMFQSYALFPHMTVAGNVAYGLEMEGMRGAELDRRVAEALDLVQLSPLAKRKPAQLSGGQKQRVALARALVKRPQLLLLDEPLGALDKKLREQMQIELKRLQQETGIAFLVVTHDQEEALTMADRIALLKAGRVAQLDAPRALYERPSSRFVADFIGQMNFLAGEVTAAGLEIPGLGCFGAVNLADHAIGTRAELAIRPERVELLDGAVSGAIAAHVSGLAYLGQDLILHLSIAGRAQPLVARVPAANPLSTRLRQGLDLWCRWPAEHSLVLSE
ncbi:spermidine/putrescine transport system ATP-binding protein/putrescine transport system ATP-binding protein [Dongia mobilis]|uniref:Spermidine/putrescine import ATP-binding protein PotA n=1 Tax=Dongia mobilis TaxID=578943 RepID=A0A4R6WWH9_9PROT|nr:ABC transporter ATP-binding protein [Dongia mobilis]TDQ86453.1 spermidine/putrescine transport system ATP-binding protein/putrescine transport system ATP-binding protein [Dongia mobilis]